MIVSDVITRVRRTFGDEAAVQVQDADIIRWINDAQLEIVKRNDSALQETSFMDLVANQSTYTMPTTLLIIRTLRYKYTNMVSFNKIRYASLQQFDEIVDGWDGTAFGVGAPIYYTMDKGQVILFPTPDQSATGGLKILHNKRPTDVVLTSDALSLPLIYHNSIFQYCMWQASLLDEDHDPAIMYQSNFMDDMRELSNSDTKEDTNTYPVITVLEFDA